MGLKMQELGNNPLNPNSLLIKKGKHAEKWLIQLAGDIINWKHKSPKSMYYHYVTEII